MLQQAGFKPGKAPSSYFVVDHTDPCELSPARMSISRVSLDVNTGLRNELLQQEEYIRRTLAAGLVKEASGMTENKGIQSKRGYKELRRDRELVFSGEDVEWGGGVIRGCKRREVSVERESRSGEVTEKDHQLVQSGSSDLTTEQSAVCMAAESNSTRTTGSLDEDGCLLKLQSTAPAAASYGDLHPHEEAYFDDEDEDHSSMPLPNAMQAACVSYDVHRPAACASLYDHHIGQDWLAASSYHDVKRPADACANYDQHLQNDAAAGEDWLQLRLGGNFSVPHVSRSTLSHNPCTLQLLPQEPDCALMKEREKHIELKLCSGDDTRNPSISKQAEQTRAPSVLQSYLQAENTRENPQNFYTSLMQASCLPMPPADSIGQYIASPAKIAAQYTSTADVSLYPTLSPLDHHTSQYIQHLQHLQHLQESNVQYRAPLHAPQEQRSFEPMSPGVCQSLREAVQDAREAAHVSAVSRSPLPDFVHQNWDQLTSSPTCSLMRPVTSFRDLIASSFLKEPNNRYDNSIPLLASLQQPTSSHMWPAKFSSRNTSPSDPHERINASNMESNFINNMNVGCKSMTSWLSQALATTEDLYVDQKLDDQSSPDGSLAPSLSRKQINAERRLAKHMNKSSKQTLLKCISRTTSRGSPGFWFALQPSQPEDCGAEITSAAAGVPKSMSYIRMKNGDVPISAVKKFLISKLGLSHDSQVGLACRGKLLEDTNDLKSIQEEIWLSSDFSHKERLNFRSSHSSNIHIFNSIMLLTYEIS